MKNAFERFLLSIALLALIGTDELSARGDCPLRVGSYNIRMNTPVDGNNMWNFRKERVKNLILFHGYDIVGVQEALPLQMDDLRQMPEFASVGIGRDGENGGEFSAIFYRTDRIQVLDSGTFWLSQTPEVMSKGWDAQLHRICTWAKMKDRKTKKVFYFFNTHLDHIGPTARRESAALLLERIGQTAGTKYPVFCTGDFNSQPDAEPIRIMRSGLLDAKTISEMPPYSPGWSYTGFDVRIPERLMQRREIDYVFVNNRVRILKYGVLTDSDGKYFPSDHFPVLVEAILR